jgi:hypothetical protein
MLAEHDCRSRACNDTRDGWLQAATGAANPVRLRAGHPTAQAVVMTLATSQAPGLRLDVADLDLIEEHYLLNVANGGSKKTQARSRPVEQAHDRDGLLIRRSPVVSDRLQCIG